MIVVELKYKDFDMIIILFGGSRLIVFKFKFVYSYLKKDFYIYDYIDIYDGELKIDWDFKEMK